MSDTTQAKEANAAEAFNQLMRDFRTLIDRWQDLDRAVEVSYLSQHSVSQLQAQSDAWNKVFHALTECVPGWFHGPESGEELAVKTIHWLAKERNELVEENRRLRAAAPQNLEWPYIGMPVKADHPITCINPTETFTIAEVKAEEGKFYVRGEHTCWFNWNMVKPAEGGAHRSVSREKLCQAIANLADNTAIRDQIALKMGKLVPNDTYTRWPNWPGTMSFAMIALGVLQGHINGLLKEDQK